MASLYRKPRSPFWYIQFIDRDGRRVNKSTKLRADDDKDTAEARILRNDLENAELSRTADARSRGEAGGWDFVPKFLVDHCRSKSGKTLTRYQQAWQWISLFLAENKIRHPREVRFAHGQHFVDWRTGFVKKSGRSVDRNTAVLDVKIFSMIMQRSVAWGLCVANPLVRLGISREDSPETPEITRKEMELILPALDKQEEWMRLSFQIARETGCRLRETLLERNYVDFERSIIHFPNPKGGKKRAFSVPLPDSLRGVLTAAFADGRKTVLTMPAKPSLVWRHFFDDLKLPHLRFHSLRVSFVTRLAREEVPRAFAMRLVNHGSELVHRVYQRLNVDDLRPYVTSSLPPRRDQTDQSGADAKA